MIPQINKDELYFPDPSEASEDGILAWGGNLTPKRLIYAYQNGIFPWYSNENPIIWWSPNPRLVMNLDDFKLSKSLKRSMKKFEYKFDTNFELVMEKCSTTPRKDQGSTWISREIIQAYTALNKMGIAHSVESYQNGELVGGLYGLAIGKVFCGESMFASVSDASKSAYAVLVKHLKEWGFEFIDCQVSTNHLKSLGAKEISREEFLVRLKRNNTLEISNKWDIKEI